MKKVVKKHYKVIIGIVVGLIVSTMGTYAAEQVLTSDEVLYTNSTSGNKTVQAAIDELYEKTNSCKEYIPNNNPNKNISKAYTYNEEKDSPTYCVSGEESGCQETTCYKSKNSGACPQGTIIDYKVNDDKTERFYVLHDDGETMTMQGQKNIIRNVAWHTGSDDSSKGPDTILPILEVATSTWTNVNEIEYTPGTTNLYKNVFTGCTYISSTDSDYKIRCDKNTYDSTILGTRKARARMITVQEAGSTGCLVFKDGNNDKRILGNSFDANNSGSCPDFMHNYMYQSTNYGGSYSDNTKDENGTYDYAYWTMSAYSSTVVHAWNVNSLGQLSLTGSSSKEGARAVIEINKSSE